MTVVVLILLFSLVAPLPLLVIEKVFPYPFIIEELIKLIFVFILVTQENKFKKNMLPFVIISGILFAVSESIFYLINIFASQAFMVFFQRLLMTGIMHSVTILIIYLFTKRRRYWWILGFIIAMIVHFLYNYILLML